MERTGSVFMVAFRLSFYSLYCSQLCSEARTSLRRIKLHVEATILTYMLVPIFILPSLSYAIDDPYTIIVNMINDMHDNFGVIRESVDKTRSENHNLSNNELSKIIIRHYSFRSGVSGGITGILGFPSAVLFSPLDFIVQLRSEAFTILSIAYIYGHTPYNTDLKTDIYLIALGTGAQEILKSAGIDLSQKVTKKEVEKIIAKESFQKIVEKMFRKKIEEEAAKKTIGKFIPLIGAPIGFGMNWYTMQGVGNFAIYYYSS